MREQRVHASLCLRRIEDELRFSVFLRHRVIVTDHDRTERLPMGRHAYSKNDKISDERHYSHSQDRQNAP